MLEQIVEISPLLPPPEAIYAYDADFITMILERKELLKANMREILLKADLKVNETKTEETTLERIRKNAHSCKRTGEMKLKRKKEIEEWRNTKKLGSLIGTSEDIKRRKQIASAALTIR